MSVSVIVNVSKEAVGGGVGVIIGLPLLWYFFKRMFAKAAFEDTSKTATDAQCSVIEMLRTEVERLSKINGEMAEAISGMQADNVKTQRENIKFREEISGLHDTINELKMQLDTISGSELDRDFGSLILRPKQG